MFCRRATACRVSDRESSHKNRATSSLLLFAQRNPKGSIASIAVHRESERSKGGAMPEWNEQDRDDVSIPVGTNSRLEPQRRLMWRFGARTASEPAQQVASGQRSVCFRVAERLPLVARSEVDRL